MDRTSIEMLFFNIQAQLNIAHYKPFIPNEGHSINDLNSLWERLESCEHKKETKLKKELAR